MLTLMLPNRTKLFDHAIATREGWDVFNCNPNPDGKPPFPDDRDAFSPLRGLSLRGIASRWDFVVTRARAGSALHRAALATVDDTERLLIEAACGPWQRPAVPSVHASHGDEHEQGN